MKAKIKASGTLVIESENELEAYALGRWSKDNTVTKNGTSKLADTSNMIIKCGFPATPPDKE